MAVVMPTTRTLSRRTFAACAAALLAAPVLAQTAAYPSQPIRPVMPSAPD